MKKLVILSALFITSATIAQELPQIPRCMSPEAIKYQDNLSPGFSALVLEEFEKAKKNGLKPIEKSGSLYTIPVVVHIVHNTSAQNIDDSVVINQIEVLNRDYNRMNSDTVNMRPDFEIVKGNPQIQFVLAGIDPLGNSTTGITRTATATQSFGSLNLLSGDFSDLEKVKSTANGGEDPWDITHYLNIWVCNMSVNFLGQEITALLGYATPPAGLPNWPPGSTNGLVDGVVIQYQAFGSNNPNILDAGAGPIEVLGRTTVHEVGHYLGLRHIWGDGDCTQDDGVADTPGADAQSNQDCDITKNTCVDDIQGFDLPDMVENYMDYSAETCQNSFTEGQIAIMHGVLENQRYDLVHGNPAEITEESSNFVTIYPNPANDKVSLNSDVLVEKVYVMDAAGKMIANYFPNASHVEMSFDSYNSGIYFIKVISSEGTVMKQIIKK